MSVDQAYNFKQASALVSTAGLLSVEQLGELGSEGYQAVVNLLPPSSEYAIDNEQSIVEQQGIEYTNIPVDFSAPTDTDYQQFAARLGQLSDKKILIHCAANYRVSAFYSIYANREMGWSGQQAREFIVSIWDLGDHPVWAEFVDSRINDTNTGGEEA